MRKNLFFVHLLVVLLSLFLIACGGGKSTCEKLIDKMISCCHLSPSSDERREAVQSCEHDYNEWSSTDQKDFDRWVDGATCSDIADYVASQGYTCQT